MTKPTKDLLDRMASWPDEDQEELIEVAQAIEARRSGVYVLTDDEQAAIEKSRQTPLADDTAVAAFWRRFGTA
jgi:hypothetical protein